MTRGGFFCVVNKDQRRTLAPFKWLKGFMAVNETGWFSDGIKKEAATAHISSSKPRTTTGEGGSLTRFAFKGRNCLCSSHVLTWIMPLILNMTFLTFLPMLSLQPFHVGMFIQRSKGMNDGGNVAALSRIKQIWKNGGERVYTLEKQSKTRALSQQCMIGISPFL